MGHGAARMCEHRPGLATRLSSRVPSGTPSAKADCASRAELPDLFERLRATAIETISRHIAGTGRQCRCCGAAWPCRSACLAEFTLGAL